MSVKHWLLTGLLALTCMSVQSKVYSSRLWDERAAFCKAVEETSNDILKVGLTAKLSKDILSNSHFSSLSKNDQLTAFDAWSLVVRRQSTFWVFDFCMDRLET